MNKKINDFIFLFLIIIAKRFAVRPVRDCEFLFISLHIF